MRSRSAWPRLIAASAALFLMAAAPPPPDPPRLTARAVRIAPDEAPNIDADLSDPAWSKADIVEGLRQVDPPTGEPGTERTLVRILYDQDNLYIGFYCYDREPEGILRGTMARDGNLATGDTIRIFLDPGGTRRDGYVFDVGASGARADGLIQNNAQQIYQWDTIWQARTRIVSDGWIVEVAIPFRSLSYDRTRTEWGFNFSRVIRRKNEALRWSWRVHTTAPFDFTTAGALTGIRDVAEGRGLDVRIYGRASFQQNWEGADRGTLSGTAGGNAYYRITPALTATLTANPDFSDAPLDPRQINLTRFSLFTPETRDFFLQDAGSFEFGGRGLLGPNARPFFSRNIGLVSGLPVTVLAGGKLSGQYEDFGIGVLGARTNANGETPGQFLSVARLTHAVLEESRLGMVVTHGDPTGLTDNTLAGADFQFRDSNFFGKTVQSDFFYERSFSSAEGDDDALGLGFNFPNEPWGGAFGMRQIGADFTPALGFLNRPDIRAYDAALNHVTRWPDGALRNVGFGGNTSVITGLDDRVQSWRTVAFANAQTPRADFAGVDIVNAFESVPAAFFLPDDVEVPAGDYSWTNMVAFVNTSQSRWLSGNFNAECCRFYDGSYFRASLGLSLRFFEAIEIFPRYSATFIDLPHGYVEIHVPTLDAAINFTPDMQLVMQAQFDNISRDLGFSARYRWEYAPGDELFAAFGQSAAIPGTSFEPKSTQLSLRLGQTLRF